MKMHANIDHTFVPSHLQANVNGSDVELISWSIARKITCTQVLENPSILEHQITRASLDTFCMSAFNVLFLIHTKVCVTTKKIYHSVKLIGDPACATHHEYNLDIQRNGAKFSKSKEVAPQECLALKENASLAIGINSLLEILGGFNGTTFTISVQKIFENKSEQGNKDIDSRSNQESVSEKKCKYHSIGCMYKITKSNRKTRIILLPILYIKFDYII